MRHSSCTPGLKLTVTCFGSFMKCFPFFASYLKGLCYTVFFLFMSDASRFCKPPVFFTKACPRSALKPLDEPRKALWRSRALQQKHWRNYCSWFKRKLFILSSQRRLLIFQHGQCYFYTKCISLQCPFVLSGEAMRSEQFGLFKLSKWFVSCE